MSHNLTIDGYAVTITDPDFAKGGQGQVQRAVFQHNPQRELVLKSLPQRELVLKSLPQKEPQDLNRVQSLVDLDLWEASPYLAAPFAYESKGHKKLKHLAFFAPGQIWKAIPRFDLFRS